MGYKEFRWFKNQAKKKMEKYRIMRLLFWGPRRYAFFGYTELPQERIIRALKKLLTYGDIKKKKIYLKPGDCKAVEYYQFFTRRRTLGEETVEYFHDNERRRTLGKKERTRRPYTHVYELTKQGKNKLAYYHHIYQYHKEWQPRIGGGLWHNQYLEGIAEIIEKQYFYKK